jgi:hypothetical protein
MNTRAAVRLAGVGLCLAAIALLGCSDTTKPKITPPRYKETVEKETVIRNLVLSYKDANIEQFTKLLHEDYTWYNQESDVVTLHLPEFYTRAEEIEKTGNMFLAAQHKHPDAAKNLDKLELELQPGDWTQVFEFEGNPSEDCWETTREYSLLLIMDGGSMTLVAGGLVKLTIISVPVDGTNVYRIIRADDLDRP